MPFLCSVYGCVNKSNNKALSFYRFPKIKTNVCSDLKTKLLAQRKAWLNSLKRQDVLDSQLNSMRICLIHFKTGKPAKYYDNKNPDCIPTIKMVYNITRSKATTPQIERYHYSKKRMQLKPIVLFKDDETSNAQYVNFKEPAITKNKLAIKETVIACNTDFNVAETSNAQYVNFKEPAITKNKLAIKETVIACNTDLTISNIDKLEQLQIMCIKLQNEINYFNFSEKTFDGREHMLTYYTGLESISVFNLILIHIRPGLTCKNQRLTEFQKLLLCLMKLRLNLPFTDIGFRFNITCSTASLIFYKVIYLLEHMFKNLIYWPEREALRSTMPRSFFTTFGNNVAVIIDCFEIGIEKPSSLKGKVQTWSSYKHV